jgi:glycosyltransferase involved in cell wall biosynthesis
MKMRELGLADTLTIYERDFTYDVQMAYEFIMQSDIVVFQRPASENWLGFIRTAQKAGKIIVCDYDDDPFSVNPLNPSYKWNGTEEVMMQWNDGKTDMLWKDGVNGFDVEKNIKHQDMFKACFRKTDLVTVTTPILQEALLPINKNTIVLPNVIALELYPRVEMVKRNVRILWQGGQSHYEDLFMVHKAIVDILKKYKNVTFVYFGDVRFHSLFKDAPQDQVEYHPWVGHKTYPYKLATLNADIGLCPITDNQFNRRKSSIKWMEYSAMGIATIASNIPPYSVDIKNQSTGKLVDDDEWYDAMEFLVCNPIARQTLSENAYAEVLKNHNADTKAYLWRDAYEKILKQDLVEA